MDKHDNNKDYQEYADDSAAYYIDIPEPTKYTTNNLKLYNKNIYNSKNVSSFTPNINRYNTNYKHHNTRGLYKLGQLIDTVTPQELFAKQQKDCDIYVIIKKFLPKHLLDTVKITITRYNIVLKVQNHQDMREVKTKIKLIIDALGQVRGDFQNIRQNQIRIQLDNF